MVPLLIVLVGLEIAIAVIGPLLPQIQREFRLSAGTVALTLAIYNGIRLLFNLPLSRRIARSALSTMLAAGSALLACGALVTALAPVFAVVIVGRAMMGLGATTFIITIQLWLARAATPETKATLFSWHQLVGLTGNAIGPVLGGAVAGWLSWRHSLGISVVIGLAAAAVGRRLPYPTTGYAGGAAAASGAAAAGGAATPTPAGVRLRPRDLLGPGMSMMGFMFFHGGVIMTLIPLFAARELGMGPAAVGTLLMLGTLQRFGSALVGARLVRAYGTRRVVVAGLGVLALSVLSFLAVGSPLGMLVAISVVSWANLGGSFVIAMVTDRISEPHWGTALGTNRNLGDLGAMIAPILVGFVIDHAGFDAAFAAAAGYLFLAAVLAGVFTARPARA